MKTLKSVMVGHSRRIAIDDFNKYLESIGTEPYPNDGSSGFLKVRECAEWLNVSIGYIYKMIYEFENEPVQIGMADISE